MSTSRARAARKATVRRLLRTGVLACAGLLPGCAATPAAQPRAAPAASAGGASDRLLDTWEQRLAAYIDGPGFGDPGVLAQLPLLRTSAVPRPSQIVFAATDIDASAPERDGYDVVGLLIGKTEHAGEAHYVFVVGAIERNDYRPSAVTDIRLVVMTPRQGALVWQTGRADPQALARYLGRLAPAAAPRFPAAEDRFTMTPCADAICAVELVSGARWTVGF